MIVTNAVTRCSWSVIGQPTYRGHFVWRLSVSQCPITRTCGTGLIFGISISNAEHLSYGSNNSGNRQACGLRTQTAPPFAKSPLSSGGNHLWDVHLPRFAIVFFVMLALRINFRASSPVACCMRSRLGVGQDVPQRSDRYTHHGRFVSHCCPVQSFTPESSQSRGVQALG